MPTSSVSSTSGVDPSSPPCEDGCTTQGETGPQPPQVETNCQDGIDDDADDRPDCFDDDCWGACEARFLRVATYNIREVGVPGSGQYTALLQTLQRIDADIVCLQEVLDEETDALESLAMQAGYAHLAAAPSGYPGSGQIRNACLSRYEIAQWDPLDEDELSLDPAANDMTRQFLRIRVNLGPLGGYLTIITAHLKAGGEELDRFRRMVEAARLGLAVDLERRTFPNNALIVMGDLNETPDAPRLTFDAPPAQGLPFSYRLGQDIAFPLPYLPFAPLEQAGLERVEARVEDHSWTDTYLPSHARLDYIYQDAASVVVSEAYDSCEDDGEDALPLGDLMPKAGDPLPCGVTGDASDHRPVVADFYFPLR